MTAAASASSAETNGRDDILAGATSLGIELGSTRIKACLIGQDATKVLATGSHEWSNRFENDIWTYALDDVWSGVREAFAALIADAQARHGARPETFAAIGISGMMHGYLAVDATGELLVPFRTWRNTNTATAAAELSDLFGVNIPLRWSIAHLHQAVLDAEPHVPEIDFVTTLAGYVHWRLTGRRVLGVGDASGMFPIDAATGDYDADMLTSYGRRMGDSVPFDVRSIFPEVLSAGQAAGRLTAAGASLLDPTGRLAPDIPLCPPEGDAGTGMVATNSVAPRTGNVSAGTSIFAMVVLEGPLKSTHEELDLVTTPSGDPVAMVHCNNGASELAAWAGMFVRFAAAAGRPIENDEAFDVLFREALGGKPDADGVLVYNHAAGEPVVGFTAGRPLIVRSPDSDLSLATFARAQLYGVFGTLALGMQVLTDEGVRIEQMFAHGGLFRTAGVAQQFLAGALGAPVAVGELADEGGSWGIAVLAGYLAHAESADLSTYLSDHVFSAVTLAVLEPDPADVAGFAEYLERYRAGLAVQAAAIEAL